MTVVRRLSRRRPGPWSQGPRACAASGVGPLSARERVAYRWRSHRCHRRRPVLDDLAYEDSESPAIGVVPAGVSWEEVKDHIKIAHHPLLVPFGRTDPAPPAGAHRPLAARRSVPGRPALTMADQHL